MIRRLAQKLIIASAGPYVRAELPKWGFVYRALVGSLERDEFWQDAPVRAVRNKLYGFETICDLAKWPERQTFFLKRWFDLPAQLLIAGAAGPSAIVVDVGANRGQFTLAAASIVGPAGRVLSFEPNPAQAAILKGDLERNDIRNVSLYEMGLSDAPARLSLCVPHINSGGASFGGFASQGERVDDIPVEVGDEVLAGIRPDLIKIDVEGFELRVLRGLRKTIEVAKPVILTEVVSEHLERCGTAPSELFEFMESMGYRGNGVGTRRNGREQILTLGPAEHASDVLWTPRDRSPERFICTSNALRPGLGSSSSSQFKI